MHFFANESEGHDKGQKYQRTCKEKSGSNTDQTWEPSSGKWTDKIASHYTG
ncbi:hypothetical protein SIN_03698 [Salmonella enterica subsp. enterica serovar Infantis]|nr:hypothetical protein SIN_03698 [Salmonella enterica subsp. enterica serovar Infantis]